MKEFLKETERIGLAIVIVLVLISFSLASFLFLSRERRRNFLPVSRREFKKGARKQLPPIKFAGEAFYLESSESFSLDIVPAEKLSALVYRLEVFFDPEILMVEKVTTGDFFENPQILRKEIDNETGRLYFSTGITPKEIEATGAPKSENLLATIFFSARPQFFQEENLETEILFGEKTMIIGRETKFENFSHLLKPYRISLAF